MASDKVRQGKILSGMSMYLAGFIAGFQSGVDHPLGLGNELHHRWLYDLASFRERHGLDPRKRKDISITGH